MADLFDKIIRGEGHAKPVCDVPAPELGPDEKVYVCSLGLAGVMKLNALKEAGGIGFTLAREMFPLCVCNVDGVPYFPAGRSLNDAEWAAVDAVPLPLVMRVVDAAAAKVKEAQADAKKPSVATAGSAS